MKRSGPDFEGFDVYAARVRDIERLDREEELALARRHAEGDTGAGHRLVESQLATVVHLARTFRGYGVPVSELVGEGNIGLLEALDRFEPERGLRFVTYARYWVRAYMLALVLRQWSMVDIGSSALSSKLFFRLQAERNRLSRELGPDDPSLISRLAERFGTSEDRILYALGRLRSKDASLDARVGEDGQMTYLDLLPEPSDGPEDETGRRELDARVRDAVRGALPALDSRERLILEKRLLVDTDEPATLATLGEQLGVTRERVRQIQVGVLSKLRAAFLRLSPA